MQVFTPEQLQYLETAYGLKPVGKTLPVKDGVVAQDTMVWWLGDCGPEYVRAGDGTHWHNISKYPYVYQLARPKYKVEYQD